MARDGDNDVTKPTKNKPATKSETARSDDPTPTRKDAAEPGAIQTRDIGPGSGEGAMAKGGDIHPIDSTLVGQSNSGRPAAEPKAAGKADPSSSSATASVSAATGSAAASAETARGSVASSGSDTAAVPDRSQDRTRGASPARQAPTPSVVIRKHGFWPVFLGGVAAAGIGAGAAIVALPYLPDQWVGRNQVAAVPLDPEAIRADAVAAARQAAQEVVGQPPEDLRPAIEELNQRVAKLESALPAEAGGQDLDPILKRLDDQAAQIEALSQKVGTAVSDGTAGAEDLVQIRQRLDAMVTRLDEQARQIETLQTQPSIDPETATRIRDLAAQAQELEQQIAAAAEQARAQIEAAKAEAVRLQEAAAESTRRAEAVAAIAALQAALDRGVTADEARQRLSEVGIEAPEALSRDVPSLASLQDSYDDASRAALRATLTEDRGGNVLTNFLRAQTGARSVKPREGNDPDAILSRANAHVEAGDIAAALDELAGLPEAARQAPAMADWIADAQAYRDAHAALSELSAAKN